MTDANDRIREASRLAAQAVEDVAADEDEARFLADYDIERYQRHSVAVDVAVLAVLPNGKLGALVVERDEQPAKGRFALPGTFVREGESLDDAARRALESKASVTIGYIEQLYTFGAPERDPRGRVISVAYYALVPASKFSGLDYLVSVTGGRFAEIDVPWTGETGGAVAVRSHEGESLPLAFDHASILGMAVARLRGKLWYTPVALSLTDATFTLLELQAAYESILGRRIDKNAFRRRIVASGLIEPTGERREGTTFRPAALYQAAAPEKGI